MNITLTGHGLEVTPALREFTHSKLDKLARHADKISRVNVTFDVQKLDQVAEATILLGGNEIYASAKADDMYHAVEGLIPKLDRQIIKHKEKITDHRGPEIDQES